MHWGGGGGAANVDDVVDGPSSMAELSSDVMGSDVVGVV